MVLLCPQRAPATTDPCRTPKLGAGPDSLNVIGNCWSSSDVRHIGFRSGLCLHCGCLGFVTLQPAIQRGTRERRHGWTIGCTHRSDRSVVCTLHIADDLSDHLASDQIDACACRAFADERGRCRPDLSRSIHRGTLWVERVLWCNAYRECGLPGSCPRMNSNGGVCQFKGARPTGEVQSGERPGRKRLTTTFTASRVSATARCQVRRR